MLCTNAQPVHCPVPSMLTRGTGNALTNAKVQLEVQLAHVGL